MPAEYCESILASEILSSVAQLHGKQKKTIFQQDSDPKHSALRINNFFKKKKY